MQLVSYGNFYMGIDEQKYCDISIHLGRLNIEYQCQNPIHDLTKPNRFTDGTSVEGG